MAQDKKKSNGLQLGTLEKAYRILDLYNSNADSLTFSEIVDKSGLEKGSVQRLLFTLENLGLLRRHQRYKRYSLSSRFISYAVSHLQADPLMLLAIKHLEPLARQTTESIGLAFMDGIHVFYLSRIPNLVSHDFALLPVRRYAFNTAAGRAIMSRMSKEDVERVLSSSPLQKATPYSIVDPAKIRRIIAQARVDGFAWLDAEVMEMEMAVAAPIIGENDMPVGAVTISIDKSRYTTDEAKAHFVPMALGAANNMSSSALSVTRTLPRLGGV